MSSITTRLLQLFSLRHTLTQNVNVHALMGIHIVTHSSSIWWWARSYAFIFGIHFRYQFTSRCAFIYREGKPLPSRPCGRLTHNREPYQKIYGLMNALRPIHPKLWQQFLDFKKWEELGVPIFKGLMVGSLCCYYGRYQKIWGPIKRMAL